MRRFKPQFSSLGHVGLGEGTKQVRRMDDLSLERFVNKHLKVFRDTHNIESTRIAKLKRTWQAERNRVDRDIHGRGRLCRKINRSTGSKNFVFGLEGLQV